MTQCTIHIQPVANCYRVFLADWAGYQLGYGTEHMHPTLLSNEDKARAIGDAMAQAAGLEVVAYLIGEYAPYRERTDPNTQNIQVGVWTSQEISKSKARSNAWIQAAKGISQEMLPLF